MYVCMYTCMYVCLCPPNTLSSSKILDPAHFWHARSLGQQEGPRLCKVALRGCLRPKLRSNVAFTT